VSARLSSARESRAVVIAARSRETIARAPAAGGDPMTRGARAESDDDAMEVGVSEEILEKGAWAREARRREAQARARASERARRGRRGDATLPGSTARSGAKTDECVRVIFR